MIPGPCAVSEARTVSEARARAGRLIRRAGHSWGPHAAGIRHDVAEAHSSARAASARHHDSSARAYATVVASRAASSRVNRAYSSRTSGTARSQSRRSSAHRQAGELTGRSRSWTIRPGSHERCNHSGHPPAVSAGSPSAPSSRGNPS
ncbi:hypothetical protein SDC9_175983 [bioreactor metagenome]|uniref:Uncharacterized protein n=1 Tax=bioreactor metagenome TaxID=1076179 RepID=A0A645GNP1_9ZZZZ